MALSDQENLFARLYMSNHCKQYLNWSQILLLSRRKHNLANIPLTDRIYLQHWLTLHVQLSTLHVQLSQVMLKSVSTLVLGHVRQAYWLTKGLLTTLVDYFNPSLFST